MTSQPVSSTFLCSPLPSGTWWTPGLPIPQRIKSVVSKCFFFSLQNFTGWHFSWGKHQTTATINETHQDVYRAVRGVSDLLLYNLQTFLWNTVCWHCWEVGWGAGIAICNLEKVLQNMILWILGELWVLGKCPSLKVLTLYTQQEWYEWWACIVMHLSMEIKYQNVQYEQKIQYEK